MAFSELECCVTVFLLKNVQETVVFKLFSCRLFSQSASKLWFNGRLAIGLAASATD